MLIAAVDQGSSSTKGALVAADGTVLARARAEVEVHREGARVTHDPRRIAGSVRAVLGALARTARPDALALACQRSTCLLWERASGAPLTPALSWQDLSAAPRLPALAGDEAEIARRTGLRLSAHYAGAKLGLLLDEVAGAREAARRGAVLAGTLDAYLVQDLTGTASTEPGHAGRTLLLDLEGAAWDPWLAERLAVPLAALPALQPSAGARGVLRDGPWDGVPLVALLGDQQAALLGDGGAAPGTAVAHFGTGAFVLAGTGEAPVRRDGLLAAVLWSADAAGKATALRYQLEGSVNSAGSAVDWALRLLGVTPQEAGPVLAAATAQPLDPDALPLCVPAFLGLGAPWWRPATATVTGLRLEHRGEDLLRGVLAGVAQRVADCVEALAAAVPLAVLRVSGRLATLPALGGLLAELSGLPVEEVADEEAGLRGAARLAAVALGAPDAVLAAPPPVRLRHLPQWSVARRAAVRDRWRRAVAAAAAAAPLAPVE